MNSDSRNLWPPAIGWLIVNFGNVEMVLFQWVDSLSNDEIVRDIAIDYPLSKRLKLLCDLIKRSNLSDEKKKKALSLWGEIGKISELRNILAHNPFITQNGQHGVIDMKKFKGISKGQAIPVEAITLPEIISSAKRLAVILQELIEGFNVGNIERVAPDKNG